MNESRRRVLLFGTDEDVAEAQLLRAGPLEVIVRGSRVGPIRCGDVEVWHGVAFLFRDANWGTPEPIVEQMESTISESSFLLRATGRFPTYPIIGFRIEIEGTAEGCVRTFTTSPIVHGAEDHSVMLTLQSLPSMIETLRARFPRTAIVVGPSTIAARSSPLGNQPESGWPASHRASTAGPALSRPVWRSLAARVCRAARPRGRGRGDHDEPYGQFRRSRTVGRLRANEVSGLFRPATPAGSSQRAQCFGFGSISHRGAGARSRG